MRSNPLEFRRDSRRKSADDRWRLLVMRSVGDRGGTTKSVHTCKEIVIVLAGRKLVNMNYVYTRLEAVRPHPLPQARRGSPS